MNKKELEKFADYVENQFEIFLKDDFMEMFLVPKYRESIQQTPEKRKRNSSSPSP